MSEQSPVLWNRLRGHSAQLDMLRRAAGRGRLAHGYLFLGPSGIGKRLVARGLAQALFCQKTDEREMRPCGQCHGCIQVAAQTHPDLLQVGCPEGKRELPIDVIAGSKERRGREGLCHDLSLRPMSATRRVAIIDDAEIMNDESANALLKTLEEPPPGSILILIASDLEPVLPTIRSRCQPLWFSNLSTDDVAAILIQEGMPPQEAEQAAKAGQGSVEMARRLQEASLRQLNDLIRSGLSSARINGQALATQTMENLEANTSNPAEQRERAQWAIRFAINYYRSVLCRPEDAGHSPTAEDLAATSLERCYDAMGHLHQSMPVPLCLSGLFDDLSKISRTGSAALHSPLLY